MDISWDVVSRAISLVFGGGGLIAVLGLLKFRQDNKRLQTELATTNRKLEHEERKQHVEELRELKESYRQQAVESEEKRQRVEQQLEQARKEALELSTSLAKVEHPSSDEAFYDAVLDVTKRRFEDLLKSHQVFLDAVKERIFEDLAERLNWTPAKPGHERLSFTTDHAKRVLVSAENPAGQQSWFADIALSAQVIHSQTTLTTVEQAVFNMELMNLRVSRIIDIAKSCIYARREGPFDVELANLAIDAFEEGYDNTGMLVFMDEGPTASAFKALEDGGKRLLKEGVLVPRK